MEDINTSEVGHGLVQLLNEFLANKKKIRRLIIIDIIIAAIIPQFFFQWAICTLGIRDSISLSKILKNAFTVPGFLLILVFFVLLLVVQFRCYRIYKKDYYIDENGNQVLKTSSPYGKEHWQFEEERKECFLMETDVNNLDETILGIDEHDRVYGLRPDLVGLNKNIMLIGSPGCGKSEAIIKNAIFQAIKRGESAVVTDSKGDLYAETAQIAKEGGYVVKVLNLKALELKNSDGCHFLKSLSGDDADSCAETIANIIIANTGDGHMDYFAVNEMNLLKALLLYVTSDPGLIRAGRNHLAEVFNIVSTNNADSLEEMFMSLSDDEPAKQAFNIFANCEPKVKGQIINGMGIRLGLLSNKYVKKICSEDEIDLTLPMQKKCLYYVVISDTDRAYKFIATLFFSLCFIDQCNYSDSLSKEAKMKQLAVNYVLDEFYATGAIPDFETKCSTARSRKISIMVCLQNIGQIEFMYPDKLYDSVLSAMTIKMLLGAGEEDTAKFFCTMLGNQTIRIQQKRYKKGAADILEGPPEYQTTEGFGTRELMTVSELMNMNTDDIVICISKHYPVKLKKYLSFRHPMWIAAQEKGLPQIRPNKHIPKWRREMEKGVKSTASLESVGAKQGNTANSAVKRTKPRSDSQRERERNPKTSGSAVRTPVNKSPGDSLRYYTDQDDYEETPIKKGRRISAKDQRGINNF